MVEDGDLDIDADPAAYPGAPEVGGDGVDSNCDGLDSGQVLALEAVAAGAWTGEDGAGAGFGLAFLPATSGDGLSDILVGAPSPHFDPEQSGDQWAGTYLVSGQATGSGALVVAATESWTTEGAWGLGEHHGFGDSVAAGGDMDQDGSPRFLVADTAIAYEVATGGAVFGYGTGVAGRHLASDSSFAVYGAAGSFLGGSLAAGEDLDGDGVQDLAVTADHQTL